jgi:hypothetical protein
MKAPVFAVVGHPNKGKSSIVATLSQNDAIAIALANSPSETLDVNGNTKVTGNVILAADNNKLILGTGGDLEIFHDGTNSYIDSDTGLLRLDGNDGVWLDDGGSNIMRITNSSVL